MATKPAQLYPTSTTAWHVRALTVIALSVSLAGVASAQSVQVAPFGGYRFGGDLYEEITATSLDIDGSPSVGAVVDVFLDHDLSVTFVYSHQDARVDVPRPRGAPQRVAMSIDHWHGGGTQEFGRGAVQPFLIGTLGLTRSARQRRGSHLRRRARVHQAV